MAKFELAPLMHFRRHTHEGTYTKTYHSSFGFDDFKRSEGQKTSDIINSGDDFLAVCQYENNRPPDVCLAYVAGVAGTLALIGPTQVSALCPDNATSELLLT